MLHSTANRVMAPQATTGTPPAATTTGPYEIRGPWSLKLTDSGKAEFYAAGDWRIPGKRYRDGYAQRKLRVVP